MSILPNCLTSYEATNAGSKREPDQEDSILLSFSSRVYEGKACCQSPSTDAPLPPRGWVPKIEVGHIIGTMLRATLFLFTWLWRCRSLQIHV